MGWTFGNLHIQKTTEVTGDIIIEKLKAYYAQFGYAACEEDEAELTIAVLEGRLRLDFCLLRLF